VRRPDQQPPFVDRERDLQRIAVFLREARLEPTTSLVRICGPAGYGKTTLLDVALLGAHEAGWVTLKGRAFASQRRAPGTTLRRIVSEVVGSDEPRLQRYLSGLEYELVAASEQSSRFELAFASFVEGLRQDYPCILAFDDAHWLDEQTVAVLDDLLEVTARHPLVVALALTSGYAEPAVAIADVRTLNVYLRSLRDAPVRKLIHTLWPEVTDDVVAAIAERAGGVPFDLVALTRQAKADGARSADAVSDSAEVLLREAIEALPHDQVEFLQVCALMQDPIELRIVRGLIPDADSLDRLIARSDRYVLHEGSTLRFRHSNIAGVARATLVAPNALRRKVLTACTEAEPKFPVDYDRIATLAADLGESDTEFSALSSLASHAFMQGAYTSAIVAFERALAVGRPTRDEFSRFYNQFGIALRLADRWTQARSVLEGAVYTGIALGAPGLGLIATALLWVIRVEVDIEAAWAAYRDLREAVRSPEDARDILAMGANVAAHRRDVAAFAQIKEESAALEAPASRYSLALFSIAEAILACGLGDSRTAARAIGEAGSFADAQQSLHRFSVECYASWIAIKVRGSVDARIRFSWLEKREDGSLAAQKPPQAALFYALELAAVLDFVRGDWEEALAKIESANLRHLRPSRGRTNLLALAAAIATLSGQESELADVIDDELDRLRRAALWDRALPLAFWRATSLHSRDPRAAQAIVESVRHRLDGPCDTTMFHFPLAQVLYARRAGDGELLAHLKDPRLEPCAPWDEAQTLLAAGLAADALGEAGGAEMLARARELFERLDLRFFAAFTADALGATSREASHLLTALGAVSWRGNRAPRPRPAIARARNLTQPTLRERSVAELVSEGLSNKEIGDRLTLSARTVEVHVQNLFGKLNVHSRTQLMRVWLEPPPADPAPRPATTARRRIPQNPESAPMEG
jgi:ATP/maltotriose-dependent transcriptional regulator MalT